MGPPYRTTCVSLPADWGTVSNGRRRARYGAPAAHQIRRSGEADRGGEAVRARAHDDGPADHRAQRSGKGRSASTTIVWRARTVAPGRRVCDNLRAMGRFSGGSRGRRCTLPGTAFGRSSPTDGAATSAFVVLVGLVGGLALGSIAAARRTASSPAVYFASSDLSDLIGASGSAQTPTIGLNSGYRPCAGPGDLQAAVRETGAEPGRDRLPPPEPQRHSSVRPELLSARRGQRLRERGRPVLRPGQGDGDEGPHGRPESRRRDNAHRPGGKGSRRPRRERPARRHLHQRSDSVAGVWHRRRGADPSRRREGGRALRLPRHDRRGRRGCRQRPEQPLHPRPHAPCARVLRQLRRERRASRGRPPERSEGGERDSPRAAGGVPRLHKPPVADIEGTAGDKARGDRPRGIRRDRRARGVPHRGPADRPRAAPRRRRA